MAISTAVAVAALGVANKPTASQYVDPCDVPAALDTLRALQPCLTPGTVAETDLPPEEPHEELQGSPPTPKSCSASCDPFSKQYREMLVTNGAPREQVAEIAYRRC
jgi:hypothetical protein